MAVSNTIRIFLRGTLTVKFYSEALLEQNNGCERMVSSSDDHTMWLWEPEKSKHCVTRLVGHQQTVNEAAFSPDGRLIASASFDKSVKIWDGATGKQVFSHLASLLCSPTSLTSVAYVNC